MPVDCHMCKFANLRTLGEQCFHIWNEEYPQKLPRDIY